MTKAPKRSKKLAKYVKNLSDASAHVVSNELKKLKSRRKPKE